MVFIGNAGNIKYLGEQVGEDNTVKRGLLLLEFLDNLINKENQKKKETKNIIASNQNIIDAIRGIEAV